MAVLSRPVLKALVTAAGVALLAAPAVVALATGWIEINFTAWNEQPGPDPTPIEAWVALALVYVAWVPLVFVGLIAAYDRLGYRYEPVQHAPRPVHKEGRRREAGMRYLRSREAPPPGAPAARGAPAPPDASSSGGARPRPPSGDAPPQAPSGVEDGD
jgi:hypothetical protein